ncbi:MAG: cytidylyltransferase domain-containing protein [Candidatus Pelagibacter sp.]
MFKTKKKKRIFILIEARSTSKRLKRKHLRVCQNKSMIEILIKKLKKLKNISGIILATTANKTDDDLVKVVRKENIKIFRGPEHNVLERVIKASKKYNADYICRVTGDCPLLDTTYVKLLIDNFYKNDDLDYISNSFSLPPGQGAAIIKLDALKKSAKYSKNKKRSEEFITSSILENTNKFKIFFLSHGQKLEKIRKRTCLDTRKDLMFIEKVAKYKNLLDVKLDDLIKIK